MTDEADEESEAEFVALVSRMLREPTLITFYIPLSHPIGFPHNSSITFHRRERVPWLQGIQKRISEQVKLDFGIRDANFVSIMLKRAKEVDSLSISQMATACSLVDEIIESNGTLTQAMETLQTRVASTVLQATTVLIAPSSGSHNEAISDALERVFEEATRFLAAYRIETQDLAVDLLSRVQCVPLVPYIARVSDFQGDESFKRGTPGIYSVNDGESLRLEHFRERDDARLFELVSETTYKLKQGDPTIAAYHELYRARRSCFLEGDFQSSAVSSFTAIEYFYGAVLNLLHWELNTPRSTVRQILDDERFSTRLKTRYHDHLGGNWDPNIPTSITAQVNKIGTTRHRVIHAGYQPNEYEARQLLTESRQLIDRLKDRIFIQLHKFGKTAFIVFGSQALKDRGGWTKRMRELIGDETEAQQTLLASYRTWIGEG